MQDLSQKVFQKVFVWIDDNHKAATAFVAGSLIFLSSLALWYYLDTSKSFEKGSIIAALIFGLTLAATGGARLILQFFLWARNAYLDSRRGTAARKVREKLANSEKALSEKQHLIYRLSKSTVFFSDRFSSAFPGIERPQWFDGKYAVKRLSVFFSAPFSYDDNECAVYPIWSWLGSGNLQIYRFERISPTRILLNTTEYSVITIAACPSIDYYRKFIYIEYGPARAAFDQWYYVKSDNAKISPSRTRETEEYGLYRGRKIVTRAEYDDNAATFLGKPVDLADNVELRSRKLRPGAFCIAPQGSPINASDFDLHLAELLEDVRRDRRNINKLVDEVKRLPKRVRLQ